MMNRIELKQEAKGVVRTAAVSAYLFALLYLALTELLQGASVYVNGDVVLYMQTYFPNVPIPSYLYPVALPTTVVALVAVVCWLLRVLLQGGWVLYHLGVRRGEEMPYATLFDGFGFIGKLILNRPAIDADLHRNWAVVAEAIQTILRRENYPNPYETLKNLTRTGAAIDERTIEDFVNGLDVSESVKEELRSITPWNYTGF